MRLHTINDYQTTARYNFLLTVEGERLFAYVDAAGIATIGIGINLRVHGRLILQTLGFDLGGTVLTDAALAAEQGYIDQLLTAISQPFSSNNTPSNQALATFNTILQQRASDTVYPSTFTRTTQFELVSTEVSRQILNQVLDGYAVPGKNFSGYESVLDTWLTRTGVSVRQPDLMSRGSPERLALLSLAFNSRVHENDQPGTPWNDAGLPTLLGPKLANALLNDDRAEAWYEIRYNSGVDARRFLEADTFGLYDSGPLGEADYKAAYRMLTRHRTKIFGADGIAGTSDDYEQVNLARLNTAIAWGNSLIIAVKNINAHLAQAQADTAQQPTLSAGRLLVVENLDLNHDWPPAATRFRST